MAWVMALLMTALEMKENDLELVLGRKSGGFTKRMGLSRVSCRRW